MDNPFPFQNSATHLGGSATRRDATSAGNDVIDPTRPDRNETGSASEPPETERLRDGVRGQRQQQQQARLQQEWPSSRPAAGQLQPDGPDLSGRVPALVHPLQPLLLDDLLRLEVRLQRRGRFRRQHVVKESGWEGFEPRTVENSHRSGFPTKVLFIEKTHQDYFFKQSNCLVSKLLLVSVSDVILV